jgi:hypothetical protein
MKLVGYEIDGMIFCLHCGENPGPGLDPENTEYIYENSKEWKLNFTRCEACGEPIIIHPEDTPQEIIDEPKW